MESLMPILLHGEAWKGDGRLENADALGVQQAGKAGGRGQDQFRLLGYMGAQEDALRHDGDVRWTHDLAKQLFPILLDVAKVAAADQDVPGGLNDRKSVGEGKRVSE